MFTACGVISVRGKTFVYDSVVIDWGRAICEDIEKLYNDNKISLKLDFIINYISDDNE